MSCGGGVNGLSGWLGGLHVAEHSILGKCNALNEWMWTQVFALEHNLLPKLKNCFPYEEQWLQLVFME